MLKVRPGLLMFLVVAMVSVGQITNTIYVPAMSLIAHGLHVHSQEIENLMAFYLLPYGLSQFVYGPLSDHYGRRPVILVGMAIFTIGSIMATVAPTYNWLLLGSLVQGMGTGVCGVMARTVMRDCYNDRKLQKANSIISVALIFAPLAAPVIGGFVAVTWGWRAMFLFLLAFGVAIYLLEFLLFPETNMYAKDKRFTKKGRLKLAYKTVLSSKTFWAYMLCLALTFGGVSVFEASSGIIFVKILHLQPQLASLLFIIPLPGYMLGCYLAGFLNKYLKIFAIMWVAIILMFTGVATMAVPAYLHIINIYVVLIPVSLFMFGAGVLFPTATTGGINPVGEYAGTAGALLGGVQNLVAGGCVLLFALIPQTTQRPLALCLGVSTLLVALIFWWGSHTRYARNESF